MNRAAAVHQPRVRRGAPVRITFLAILVGLSLLATGCSNFGREWREAARSPVPAEGVGGRWEGIWRSEPSGHHGRLRAILTPSATNGLWRARFHATYAGILTFTYTAGLRATPGVDAVRFEGTADLGRFAGGTYHYDGRATATDFVSTYTAPKDHGKLELRRPVR